jgi:hypothetical protein
MKIHDFPYIPLSLIFLVVLVAVVLYFSHDVTYDDGSDAIYESGYDDGYYDGYDDGFEDGGINACEILDWKDFVIHLITFDDGYTAATSIDYVSEYNIDLSDLDEETVVSLLQEAYQNGYGDGCEYSMDNLE